LQLSRGNEWRGVAISDAGVAREVKDVWRWPSLCGYFKVPLRGWAIICRAAAPP